DDLIGSITQQNLPLYPKYHSSGAACRRDHQAIALNDVTACEAMGGGCCLVASQRPLHAAVADLPLHLPEPALPLNLPEPLAPCSPRLMLTFTAPLPFTLPDTVKSPPPA